MLLISEMGAYVMEDGEGEGIPAFLGPDGVWLPLVGADSDRMKSLRPMAEVVANEKGRPIKLIRFDNRVDVETINPAGPPTPSAGR
jgi:hypothetical protein